MAEFPALPLWTDAYLGDTQHLTLEEHGAYLKLLIIMWRTRSCSLPDDDKRLATMLGISLKRWINLRPALLEFFSIKSGTWEQKRLTKERRYVAKLSLERSEAGKRGAEAKRLKNQETETARLQAGLKQTASTHTHTLKQQDSDPDGSGEQTLAADPPASIDELTEIPDAFKRPKPEEDLRARIWGPCLQWLAEHTDKAKDTLRPVVGRWCRDYGDGKTLVAFQHASRDSPNDPISWIEAHLRRTVGNGKTGSGKRSDPHAAQFAAFGKVAREG